MEQILHWDRKLFFWINHHFEHPVWNATLPWLEREWHFLVPLALILLWIFLRGEQREKVYVAGLCFSLLLSQTLVQGLKNTVKRPRPLYAFSSVKTHFLSEREKPGQRDYSFPSGHTAFFFTLATFSVCFYPRWILAFFLFSFACLVGFSRIYLGVHYPLDVLVGAVIGMAVGCASWKWVRRKVEERK